jgi:DNA-binding transcriptional ArsR family regulator
MTYHSNAVIVLADPTRLAVFELVAARPRSVAEITRSLPVSQSAVSQHLKVLKAASLVRAEAKGARNIYRVDLTGVLRMRKWLDSMWDSALAAFAEEVSNTEINSNEDETNDK